MNPSEAQGSKGRRIPADTEGGTCSRILDFATSAGVMDGDGDQHRIFAERALGQAYRDGTPPVWLAIAESLLAIAADIRGLRDDQESLAKARADREFEEADRPMREAWIRRLSR